MILRINGSKWEETAAAVSFFVDSLMIKKGGI